jgi:hypothetical protein
MYFQLKLIEVAVLLGPSTATIKINRLPNAVLFIHNGANPIENLGTP